jgi:ribosomal protein S18 acetylase RimI-like enzyme
MQFQIDLITHKILNLAARRFYLRQGYAETARIPGYYRGRETAVRMLREIGVKP